MIALRTLGGLDLEDEDGKALLSVLSQPKRIALLVYLAAAGAGSFVRRDSLLALFWPESDTEHARISLRQAVHFLRRSLGADAILNRGDVEIGVNPALIACDVWDLAAAIDAGDHRRAVALYAGEFLPGFHVDDAPEVERWIDRERERWLAAATGSLRSLAEAAGAEGDHAGAARWWSRLVELDPFRSAYVQALIASLAESGDRAGALDAAQRYEQRVRLDLGIAPDAAVARLADRLRLDSAPAGAAEIGVPVEERRGSPGTAPEESTPSARRPFPVRLRRTTALALLVVSVIGGGTWLLGYGGTTGDVAEASRLAVLPFAVRGDAEHHYLAEGLVELLSTNLDGAGELRTVDPHALLGLVARTGEIRDPTRAQEVAQRFGAGRYLLGSVFASGGRLRITASLYEVRSDARLVATESVEGDAAHVIGLVDELTIRLLARLHPGPAGRATRIAAMTSHSLPALKAYLEGEREIRAGRFEQAVEALQQAVTLDTTFARAHHRLSIAAEWLTWPELASEAAERAVRHSARLSAHDRMLLESSLAARRGAADEAERLYRNILSARPDDVEAWHQLGEVLFHYGPWKGRPVSEARPVFDRVLTWDSANVSARWHLARVAAAGGRGAEVELHLEHILAAGITRSAALELVALRAVASGDETALARAIAEFERTDDQALLVAVWSVAVFAGDLRAAERLCRLLTAPERASHTRAFGHVWLAHLAQAQGQLRRSAAELQAAEGLDRAAALEYRGLFSSLPFLPITPQQVEATREQLLAWSQGAGQAPASHLAVFRVHDTLHPLLRAYLLGILSARLGDSPAVSRYAGEVRLLAGTPEAGALASGLASGVRASGEWWAGRAEGTLRELDGGWSETWYERGLASPFVAQSLERYLQAEALAQVGRDAEAMRRFGSFAQTSIFETVYLAPSHLRRAELHERLGQPELAREHYARFVELWRDADAELQPLVRQAEQRLRSHAGHAAGSHEQDRAPPGSPRRTH